MKTQTEYESAKSRHIALAQELELLPAQIERMARAGNTVAVRQLRQRSEDLPMDLAIAAEAVLSEDLAECEATFARHKAAIPDLQAEVAEFRAQRDAVQSALDDAEARLQAQGFRVSAATDQRDKTKARLEAVKRENARMYAGVALGLHPSQVEGHYRLLQPLVQAMPDGERGGEVAALRPEWRDNTPASLNRPR